MPSMVYSSYALRITITTAKSDATIGLYSMNDTTNVPRWADGAEKHRIRERSRFKLYSLNEIWRMSEGEWQEECDRDRRFPLPKSKRKKLS